MAIVRIGQWLAAVDDRLLELAAQCSSVEQFCVEAEPGARVRLNLRWTQPDRVERWIQLAGEGDQPGMYCIQGDSLRVCIPADAPAAEAAVRALFQIATLRQGGVLLHAASASFRRRSDRRAPKRSGNADRLAAKGRAGVDRDAVTAASGGHALGSGVPARAR